MQTLAALLPLLFSVHVVYAQTVVGEFGAFASLGLPAEPSTNTIQIPQGTAAIRLTYRVDYSFSSHLPASRIDATYRLQITGPGLPGGSYEDGAGEPYGPSPLYALQGASSCVQIGGMFEVIGQNSARCIKEIDQTINLGAAAAQGP